jgi:transposase
VLRARIVLLAASGWTNPTIAARVGVCVDTVRKWGHRWWVQPGTAWWGEAKRSGRPPSFTPVQVAARVGVCVDTVRKWGHRWWVQPGTAWWGDAKRSGRPPSFTPVQVAALKALACQPPEASGLPLSRWSCPDLAAQVVADGIAASVSTSTVRRWLGRGRDQTLAVPVLDLRHRPELRRQGRGSLTCTTGSGTGDRCQQTTTSSPPTKRPRSKPGAGATHRCRQAMPG